MSRESATVFVVDDDPSVRKALDRLLRSAGYRVRAFATAQEFLRSDYERSRPACVVLDVKMPGLNGLGLQEALLSRVETLPIVFITGHGDIPTSVNAMKKGAVDFLPKPFEEGKLLEAVREAIANDSRAQESLEELKALRQRLAALTPREHEVLTYVITGMLNKQIAHFLGIREKTVIVHRGRVMEKLGVGSVAELVQLAAKAGVEAANVTP